MGRTRFKQAFLLVSLALVTAGCQGTVVNGSGPRHPKSVVTESQQLQPKSGGDRVMGDALQEAIEPPERPPTVSLGSSLEEPSRPRLLVASWGAFGKEPPADGSAVVWPDAAPASQIAVVALDSPVPPLLMELRSFDQGTDGSGVPVGEASIRRLCARYIGASTPCQPSGGDKSFELGLSGLRANQHYVLFVSWAITPEEATKRGLPDDTAEMSASYIFRT